MMIARNRHAMLCAAAVAPAATASLLLGDCGSIQATSIQLRTSFGTGGS